MTSILTNLFSYQPSFVAMKSNKWLILIVTVCLVGFSGLFLNLYHLTNQLIERYAIEDADRYSRTIEAFRAVYSSEVVARIRGEGIEVRHDYELHDGAIPLPATLSMLLGKRIARGNSELQIRLYSDYPFPWREKDGGAKDAFEILALEKLRENASEPFFRFEEEKNGNKKLRYAKADIMKVSCVNCHNTHPDSPKRDWKVGDVRGVLEISVPLSEIVKTDSEALDNTFMVLIAVLFTVLLMVGMLVGKQRLQATLSLREAEVIKFEKERKLQKSQMQFSLIMNSIADAIISFDEEGTLDAYSNSAGRIFGYTQFEAANMKIFQLLSPEGGELLRGKMASFMDNSSDNALHGLCETEGRRKDGTIFPLEISVTWTDLNSGFRFAVTCRDITDRKKAEEESKSEAKEQLQTQKMESLGILSGGIAHEINTPVQYVNDNLSFLEEVKDDLEPLVELIDKLVEANINGDPTSDLAKEIREKAKEVDMEFLSTEIPNAISQGLEGTKRISKIVLAIKEFSHPNSSELIEADINNAIEMTKTISRNQWKYLADVQLDLDDNLPMVPCLIGAFNQVILNMIINAAHAIEENGDDQKGLISISTHVEMEMAVIEISDNGAGIPADKIDKIFDPFFTTKETGKGTGQGLAISHTIITKKHGGQLNVESKQGIGTKFTIRLPLKPNS